MKTDCGGPSDPLQPGPEKYVPAFFPANHRQSEQLVIKVEAALQVGNVQAGFFDLPEGQSRYWVHRGIVRRVLP